MMMSRIYLLNEFFAVCMASTQVSKPVLVGRMSRYRSSQDRDNDRCSDPVTLENTQQSRPTKKQSACKDKVKLGAFVSKYFNEHTCTIFCNEIINSCLIMLQLYLSYVSTFFSSSKITLKQSSNMYFKAHFRKKKKTI